MPLITLDQILSPLKLDPNDPLRLLMSGSLVVTGSSIFIQDNPNKPAISVSGSQFIVDSPNVSTGSININQYDTIGDQQSPDVMDVGTF
jgi:hypothetical protein